MKQPAIIGYLVAIIVERIGDRYYASAPGIGSIYIEEDSPDKAMRLAQDAAISIFKARRASGREIIKDNAHLKVIRRVRDKKTISPAIGSKIEMSSNLFIRRDRSNSFAYC